MSMTWMSSEYIYQVAGTLLVRISWNERGLWIKGHRGSMTLMLFSARKYHGIGRSVKDFDCTLGPEMVPLLPTALDLICCLGFNG